MSSWREVKQKPVWNWMAGFISRSEAENTLKYLFVIIWGVISKRFQKNCLVIATYLLWNCWTCKSGTEKRWYLCFCCINCDYKLATVSQRVLKPSLPTMYFTHWVTSLEAVYQMTCSFLWRQTTLFFFFFFLHMLPRTCNHTQSPFNKT